MPKKNKCKHCFVDMDNYITLFCTTYCYQKHHPEIIFKNGKSDKRGCCVMCRTKFKRRKSTTMFCCGRCRGAACTINVRVNKVTSRKKAEVVIKSQISILQLQRLSPERLIRVVNKWLKDDDIPSTMGERQ